MTKHKNSFTDTFKYLTSAITSIDDIGKKINSVLNSKLPNRLLSRANIFNMTIDVTSDLTKLVLLQVEDSLVEQNMLIAEKELSVRGLATLSGHEAVRPMSSEGIIKLSILNSAYELSPIITFQDLILKCETNGLMYIAKDKNIVANSSSTIFVDVIEGSWVTSEIIASGNKLEIINLDDINAIDHNNVEIFVNGTRYTKFDALYDMQSISTGYIIKNGIKNQIDVIFGDDIHGKKLQEGDTITIKHLVTNGELGNLQSLAEANFNISEGVYDINGNELSINDDILIYAHQGFVLGSNGENIETTRLIAGYNSRSLVFTKPENVKAFLSRLSILSYVDVWAELDGNVYKLLLLPNIKNKINEYRDYLTLQDLTLSTNQKTSIIEYLNTSGSQHTSTEVVLVEPQFCKYATFVYVSGNILDTASFKCKVENAISKVFLDETLLDSMTDGLITQNEIVESITSISNVVQCNIDVFSEENEIARINGRYELTTTRTNGAALTKSLKSIIITNSENPNLGFDDLGGINTTNKNQIPLLRGGFKKFDVDGNHFTLEKAIYIFVKNTNGDFELIN